MRKLLLFLLCLLFSYVLTAQQHSITGRVFSQSLKNPLAYSTISLINNKDSSVLFVTISDTIGRFSMPVLATGNLTLSISYAGFVPLWVDVQASPNKSIKLDSLFLKDISSMDSVLITAKRPPVEMINDTLQFNTENYKTPPNAVVEDMLKRMPGVTVDKDGNVRFNGKSVRRVLVNGKELFTGNPKMATQNFNADWVDKVQVYERKSDRAQFTGMDDGQTETTVNLVLKKDKLKAVFGRTSAAIGAQDRFDIQATVNQFKTDKQRSFIGMANNTNKQGFALSDMLGFNQSLFMGGTAMINAGDFGLPVSDMGNSQQGVANTYAGGININESWKKKTDLNASFQLSDIQLLAQKNTRRENLLPGNKFIYQAEGENNRTNKQQRFNATFEHKIDSFHSLRIMPQLSLQQEELQSFTPFNSYYSDNLPLNSGFTHRTGNTERLAFNNNILLRKRFRKKGRTLSSTIVFGHNEDKTNGELLTENRFYSLGMPTFRDSVFNQYNNINVTSALFNGGVTFTEQVGKRSLLEMTGYYNSSTGSSNRQTLDYNILTDKYDLPNSALTNLFSMNQESKGGTLRLRSNFKKINASIGATTQRTYLRSKNRSISNVIKQSFSDILPTASLRYAVNSKTNLQLNYTTNIQTPTAVQLQPVADVADPLNIYKGNPALQRAYVQSVTANLTNINLPRSRNIFMMASVNKTNNAIVQSDEIDASGRRITTPVNANGVVNAFVNLNTGFSVRSLKSTINIGVGVNHTESLAFINGLKNKMTNRAFSPNLNWNISLDKKLLVYASARWNITKASYSLQPVLNNTFLQQVYSLELTNYFPGNIHLSNNIAFTVNSGRAAGFNNKISYWTAAASKSFMKNNRGEIKLTALDILNQNIGVSRVANQQFIEDTRYNVLRRYFMLSFLYILNKSGKNTGGVFIQTR